MSIDLIMQNVHAAQIESARLQNRVINEQLRIARMTRPSLSTRIGNAIGPVLIDLGQRLQQEPATSPGMGQAGTPTARTV